VALITGDNSDFIGSHDSLSKRKSH